MAGGARLCARSQCSGGRLHRIVRIHRKLFPPSAAARQPGWTHRKWLSTRGPQRGAVEAFAELSTSLRRKNSGIIRQALVGDPG